LLQLIKEQYVESITDIVFDTWHTIARMEDPRDQGESIRLMNLTLELTNYGLAMALARHNRKSGGEVGLSGINSIAISGLVDTVILLERLKGNQRKLTIAGRLLNTELIVDRVDGEYQNLGNAPKSEPETKKDLLQFIPEHQSGAMTQKQICEYAGIKRDGSFRRQLERLVEQKLVATRTIERTEKIGRKKQAVYWRTVKGGGSSEQMRL
jgi:hypothetical protein